MVRNLTTYVFLMPSLILCSCREAHRRPGNVTSSAVSVNGVFIDCTVDTTARMNRCTVYREGDGEILAHGLFGSDYEPAVASEAKFRYAGYRTSGREREILLLDSPRLMMR